MRHAANESVARKQWRMRLQLAKLRGTAAAVVYLAAVSQLVYCSVQIFLVCPFAHSGSMNVVTKEARLRRGVASRFLRPWI
jgi:hypothetical protein